MLFMSLSLGHRDICRVTADPKVPTNPAPTPAPWGGGAAEVTGQGGWGRGPPATSQQMLLTKHKVKGKMMKDFKMVTAKH